MKLFKKNINSKVGLPPGTVTYSGEVKIETTVQAIQYNTDEFEAKTIINADEINVDDNKVTWISISGFENDILIKSIAKKVKLHNLFLEDIFNSEHTPKFEEYGGAFLFLLKNYYLANSEIEQNHCALYYSKNLIVTFQEFPNPILDAKIERINNGIGRARQKAVDYLIFVILDAFIDTYYSYFEVMRKEIEVIEDGLLLNKKENKIDLIYHLNKKLNYLRKNILPLKDAVLNLTEDELEIIEKDNYKYFNDIVDHVKDLIEYFNSFQGLVKGLVDLNENNINSNANEVMKTLTIVASIFIPLSFIAGVFGMNFKNMPELKWEYGYYGTLGLMVIISVAMLIYMKIKKWF